MSKLPELLAPAGSMAALQAAIEGGADAVYFGASAFNARMFAKNFATEDSLREAVRLCHAYGVRAYVTLNTAVYDRELDSFLHTAKSAYEAGADAFIVSDIGAAARLRRAIPDAVLHASTQFSAHNTGAAYLLRELGFCRAVLARETPLRDIRSFVRDSGLEAEVFVHGALCVSHSGQCLFSSMVGGRSGNRGECAQPCRLPYRVGGRDLPVLSLKDLCLAAHVTDLIESGVSSLKIEGRMKSPEYVYAVTSAWRRLLDEGRNATEDEMRALSDVFSRSGFTDAYVTEGKKDGMLGVRSEENKAASRTLAPFEGLKRRLEATVSATFRIGAPSTLTLSLPDGRSATAHGVCAERAENPSAVMDVEAIKQNLLRFGNTPLIPVACHVEADEGLVIRRSAINALRREAVDRLLAEPIRTVPTLPPHDKTVTAPTRPLPAKTAFFALPRRIPKEAEEELDLLFVPLMSRHKPENVTKYGVALPPVIFDHEREPIMQALEAAAEEGIRHLLLTNPGQLAMVKDGSFILHGDLRLNITNGASAEIYRRMGVEDLILSPELKIPQLRDIPYGRVTVYGRLPLMLLEKCVTREIAGCQRCREGFVTLTDRTDAHFPVLREPDSHRNVIYNSHPTYMADRSDVLLGAGLSRWHFIFSDESPEEIRRILEAYRRGTPSDNRKIRRI